MLVRHNMAHMFKMDTLIKEDFILNTFLYRVKPHQGNYNLKQMVTCDYVT